MVAKAFLMLFILLGLTAFSMPTASALLSDVFEIGLSYSGGEVIQESMQITKGFIPRESLIGDGSYGITVISYTGRTLWESGFSFPLEAFAEPDESCYDESLDYYPDLCNSGNPSQITFETAETAVYVPYYASADKIEVSDPQGNEILSIDVSGYSCGNGFCDTKEDENSCPADCSGEGMGYQETGYLYYIIAVAAVAGVILVFLLTRFSRKRTEPEQPALLQ